MTFTLPIIITKRGRVGREAVAASRKFGKIGKIDFKIGKVGKIGRVAMGRASHLIIAYRNSARRALVYRSYRTYRSYRS